MAVIKQNPYTLKALTATALSLPGLMSASALAAEGDEVSFQYSHYQEGKRDIFVDYGTPYALQKGSKSFNPIEVESLHGSAKVSLTDRIKFAFNYVQDTWGGATPVATTPAAFPGNKPLNAPGTDVLTGSSPYVTAGLALDAQFRPLDPIYTEEIDPDTGFDLFKYRRNNRLQHVMATASPETRKQGDFKLSYAWDEVEASIGGGVSIEDDYESRFGNLGTRFDFNQKQTTANVDLSYTNSETKAILDHDSLVSIKNAKPGQIEELEDLQFARLFKGTRQDWAAHLGLSQVLNKDAVLSADVGYTRSTGYLGNPYKGVAIAFIDPDKQGIEYGTPPGGYHSTVYTLLEQRPEARNQWNLGGRLAQFVAPFDAAVHLDYRFSADDWGIHAHTFEADWVQPLGSGWTVTPRIRYYSQDAASFYTPWLVTQQAFSKAVVDVSGNPIIVGNDGKEYSRVFDPATFETYFLDKNGNRAPASVKAVEDKRTYYDPKKLPAHFSSDHRLSGFGTLSGGVTVTKQFAKGLILETGFEYYTHQGGLKLGGGGEGEYADFDYWLANAALKVNLDALSVGGGDHAGHQRQHHHEHGAHTPAGLLFGHMLPEAGDFMAGYRFQWNSQNGALRTGTHGVSDAEFIANACPDGTCFLAPTGMNMSMHMLDLMYAPTDWLTLMLMPQWADMSMETRKLEGVQSSDPYFPGNHLTHHAQNTHESGGFGDLGMYALFKLYDDSSHHLHVTPGFTAPVADVDLQLRRNHGLDGGFQHYCMMLGSGTWDFTPSLSYTGLAGDWSWGAQANGVLRMGSRNKSGYKLGDIFQFTAWGGYNLTTWLTATLRGAYTTQGSIRGQFTGSEGGQFVTKVDKNGVPTYSSILKFGSMDYPGNYGGRFGDIGFGLSAMVSSGGLAGNRISLEWLQPVYNDMNGYQQNRDGTLNFTWSYGF